MEAFATLKLKASTTHHSSVDVGSCAIGISTLSDTLRSDWERHPVIIGVWRPWGRHLESRSHQSGGGIGLLLSLCAKQITLYVITTLSRNRYHKVIHNNTRSQANRQDGGGTCIYICVCVCVYTLVYVVDPFPRSLTTGRSPTRLLLRGHDVSWPNNFSRHRCPPPGAFRRPIICSSLPKPDNMQWLLLGP